MLARYELSMKTQMAAHATTRKSLDDCVVFQPLNAHTA